MISRDLKRLSNKLSVVRQMCNEILKRIDEIDGQILAYTLTEELKAARGTGKKDNDTDGETEG